MALLRISLGIATILNAWELYALLSGIADGRFAMPLLDWVPTPSSMSVTVYLVLAGSTGVAITVGYRVPVAASISTVLSAGVFLWDQQTYSSYRWLALLLVVYLIATRSDSVWSVGQRRSREPSPGPPTWPRTLVMSQLTVCYAFAALSKVNPYFLSGQPLTEWIRWEPPLTLALPLAYATVATELFLAAGSGSGALVAGLRSSGSPCTCASSSCWRGRCPSSPSPSPAWAPTHCSSSVRRTVPSPAPPRSEAPPPTRVFADA